MRSSTGGASPTPLASTRTTPPPITSASTRRTPSNSPSWSHSSTIVLDVAGKALGIGQDRRGRRNRGRGLEPGELLPFERHDAVGSELQLQGFGQGLVVDGLFEASNPNQDALILEDDRRCVDGFDLAEPVVDDRCGLQLPVGVLGGGHRCPVERDGDRDHCQRDDRRDRSRARKVFARRRGGTKPVATNTIEGREHDRGEVGRVQQEGAAGERLVAGFEGDADGGDRWHERHRHRHARQRRRHVLAHRCVGAGRARRRARRSGRGCRVRSGS